MAATSSGHGHHTQWGRIYIIDICHLKLPSDSTGGEGRKGSIVNNIDTTPLPGDLTGRACLWMLIP
jgi:hypothetical protein